MVELSQDLFVSLFPELGKIDPDAAKYRYGVTAASCLISLAIFLVSYVLSRPLKGFQRLSPAQKVFWAATVVRGLFGFWSIFFGLWYLLFDDNLHVNIITEYDVTSHLLCFINLGFFIFEFSCLMLSNIVFRQFDIALFTHHAIALVMYFLFVSHDIGHYVAIVSALLEMTTPFSCICWLLLKLGKQNTKFWSHNQIILIHLFHCRSVMEMFWWWQAVKFWDSIVEHFPVVLIVDVMVGLVATTFFLTPYWTMKKTEQFFKRADWNYSAPDTSPADSTKKNGQRSKVLPPAETGSDGPGDGAGSDLPSKRKRKKGRSGAQAKQD